MAADVFDQLVALLSEAKAKFRVIEHEAEGRSEAISVIRGNRPDQAAKAMVLDVRGGGAGKRHVLAILPGNRKLDFTAVANLFEARKCGFASPDTAQELTGCVMGSVPPFSLESRTRDRGRGGPARPTTRCSSTPAASTARWSSTPRTGWP